jgi:endonuclease III
VLLFCFNKPTFPVDTHIQRISQRVGVSRRKASPTEVTRDWEPLVDPASYYELHIHLIRHGREICTARNPRCEVCPLQDACDYYQGASAWAR